MKKILYVFAILFVFSSCAKQTELKLIGEWSVEDVGDCGWDEDASWTFYSGGRLDIHSDVPHVPSGETLTADFEVFTRSVVIPYVRIKRGGAYNGVWRVDKANTKKLRLNRVEFLNGDTQGAFLRREFTK